MAAYLVESQLYAAAPQPGERGFDMAALSARVFNLVCRTNHNSCGFALVSLPADFTSHEQRRLMVDLKEGLSALHFEASGSPLEWFNMMRFDQKNTTKPHRDAAPVESLLILGYEPSAVKSHLAMYDYSARSFALGITPEQFLEAFNPMHEQSYENGLAELATVASDIDLFDAGSFQILVVNNSCAAYSKEMPRWQGVLHSAVVDNSAGSRVINSTCVAPRGDFAIVEEQAVSSFLYDDALAGSNY
ncbi:MAG: hypothetical protein BWY75_00439 [bacterium ADurb.Bin425]|nr:MAG: hypothetical protein BWY75_00439 [bacterium ADurb.Bin425]